jgi:mRNA-degrading endonuclease toxin of MazEF toxin-antitoxin module
MGSLYQFNRGDIYYADFPFEENSGKSKERTVFVWKIHENGQEVLVSKITSVIRNIEWEILLKPGIHSGIKKSCVVRVDQTRALPIGSFRLPLLGTLNPFEIEIIEPCFKKYTAFYLSSVP